MPRWNLPLLDLQFVRFLLVGTFNTLSSYLVYAFFLYVGLGYATANFLSLCFGIVLSFKTQGALVFGRSEGRLFWRFAAFWVVIYLCNIGLIAYFLTFGMNAYVAGALCLPIITMLSYFIQKNLVFPVKR